MKRHLTQKCTPLLALFLSLALLLSGMVPLSYFSFAAAEFSAEASAPEVAEEPTALYELTELRQADTKYIQMSDGTVRALVYDTAVHRPDGQEGYTEIDNRLSEKGDGVENADARIKFSKKITGNGTLFTLHEGNRKITLSLPGAVKKTPVTVVRDGTDNTKAATKLEELSTLSKAVSSVGYRNILPQTDIEYILQGDNLKENIVVNAPRESYEYIFELELCNLTASLTDTGDIALNDGEERIYILPAPFMYDADGRYSEAVEYTLTPSNGNGKYTLTVTADESWLNAEKRTFPVTIDPTITAACTPQTASTVISSSGGTVRHCFTLGQNTPAYILLSNLPNALELPVLAAELRLNAYQCSSGLAGARLSLYSMEYTGTFEDLISGNAEVPDSALHPIDTQYVNGWMQFTYDLLDTGFFLGALNGENLYYKLTMTENEYDENLLFYSCEATGDGQKPVLTITYGYLQSRVLDYAESDKGFFITDTYQPQFAGDYQSIRILVTQNNSSIPALHEYGTQPDARGFFHLISGETGFKIFGTYDLNYLYIAENEGTKTPRFGATQDEWVIVGMRNYDYLILSAEDPTLSLTRTDTGVALQSLEKDNEDQVWRFYENIMTQSADVRYIQSGIYYINNNQTKTFLTQKQDYLLGIQLEAGTEAALGNRMAWYIGYAGDGQYMIQSLENPDYILTAGASSPMLVPQEVFDDTETFQITPSSSGGYSIKCTYTMYEDSDETETVYMGVSSSGSLVHCTATDDSTSWRLCKQEDYKELVEFGLYGEEQYRTSPDVLDSYTLNIGDTMAFTTYNHSPSNPTWASFSDYDFLVSSNNVTINRTAMTLTAVNAGNLTFTARHIPTNLTKSFQVFSNSTDPFFYSNIEYANLIRIKGKDFWGAGSETDHSITIVKSRISPYPYATINDNLNNESREYQITTELINSLENYEALYQEHYSFLPLLDRTTPAEQCAHASKGETDQLVEDGYFTQYSAEYYAVWAYNFVSTTNLMNILDEVIDTATKAYNFYIGITAFYYSYMYQQNLSTYRVSQSQYTSKYQEIDDIATQLTHNPDSPDIMLGTKTKDGRTWFAEGESRNMCYFHTSDEQWNSLINTYGKPTVDSANREFINRGIASGKTFYFSHYPPDTLRRYADSSFAMELRYLQEQYGISSFTDANFVLVDGIWKFVPFP